LGPGRGPGLGVGLGSRDSLCSSSGVMSCRHLPFARLLAAHLPRIAAPALAGSHLSTPVWISPVLKQLVGRRVPSWHCGR
jgi:hypothetical protein